MLYHWSVHNKLKTKKERKHISILIRFFHFSIFFLTFSLLGRVILSRSSFIQTSIFVKTSFWSFFNMVHFFTSHFYSRQDTHFFYRFQFFNFFEENEWDIHFLIFLFKNKLSYYEKGTEWKPFFFKDSKHIFWFWQESNFRVLITL